MDDRRKHHRKGNGGDEPAFSVVDRRPGTRTEDTPPPPPEEPRVPRMVEDLKARADEAERRTREISAAYRRLEEERDAFRERLSRDLERRVDLARAEMMRSLLGVLDDLDRALEAGRSNAEAGALLEGVALTREHLLKVLASQGVQMLDLVGQRFDPNLGEAVSVEETSDPGRDGMVVGQSGRGYLVGATLLRPARVRVARYRADSEETASPD